MGCITCFFSDISRTDVLQIGHVACCRSHMSMQFLWKECPQLGMKRRLSSFSYSVRQIVHLRHENVKHNQVMKIWHIYKP